VRDVRFALRGFRRNPVFAVTVIATLALGIGATTAVFSVVDRILFRSLPYANDGRLVSFGLSQPLEPNEFTLGFFFFDWRAHQRPFEAVTYERGVGECNLTDQNPVQMHCAEVAGNFLSTLGVAPVLGRDFVATEDQPNGPRAALLTYGVWKDRYGRAADVIGKTIDLDGHAVRVVGVLPENFEMPRLQPTDIVLPAQIDTAHPNAGNAGLGMPLWAFGRLIPGVSVAQARAEMEPLFEQLKPQIPAQFRDEFRLAVRSVRDRQMQDAYRAAWVLLGAVLAMLLIACANVAGLFSARGAARVRELAVRAALGASRGRLIRQTLTEAALLAAAGAVAGCALAWALLRAFVAIAPTGVPFLAGSRVDLRVLGFALLVSAVCAALFGVLPALERPQPGALTARATGGAAHVRMRRALVVAQIATSVALLACASLLVKSFRNLEEQRLGMDGNHALLVRVPLVASRYTTSAAYMDFFLRAEAVLRRVPGVTAVGISDSAPLDATGWHDDMRYPDLVASGKQRTPPGVGGRVGVRRVTPDYFRALEIRMERGRAFSDAERSTGAAEMILSHTLAERMFPGQDAVGQHVQIATYLPYFTLNGPVYTVLGVAGDVKNAGLAGEDDPEFYTLRRNRAEDWSNHNVLVVQTALSPAVVGPWIRAQIAALDRMAPVEITPMRETVQRLADRPRFEAALLGLFAGCGLLLAGIGLYGVTAYAAAQRTQEVGVRMALGATREDILRLIGGEGARLIVVGSTVGLGVALGVTRLLKSLLFHIQSSDPASYVAAAVLLACVAAVATLIPALTAMKTDPMLALRRE
jgi:putative ABC transport system permease protein